MSKFWSVMLVDDNPADNFYHRIILEDSKKVQEIYEFLSAEEALVFLQEEKKNVHLIFLDINMPGMNGFEFLARIIHQGTFGSF